jgi:hypothetical protein
MSYFLVSISNDGGAPEQAYRKMQSAGACPEAPFAEMFKFEVPSLTVGTLDTLMTLSDDLVKTANVVEQTVRKIERTTGELFGGKSTDLTVGGKLVCFVYRFYLFIWCSLALWKFQNMSIHLTF